MELNIGHWGCAHRRGVPLAPVLPGWQLQKLMRRHRVTILELGRRLQVTPTRVREARLHGVGCYPCACSWYEAVTGQLIYSPRLATWLTKVSI